MKQRAGYSAVELITTLALLALIGAACALLVQSQSRLLRHETEIAATSEAMRSARALLRAELRSVLPEDVRAITADSVALRVFRGWGIVCARADDRVAMRYHGLRDPDPAKDSLLLAGEERVLAFRQTYAGTFDCALHGDEQLITIEPAATLHLGSLALFFESGAYHLATSALRYRRGAEGRQPLTDELIDTRRSFFIAGSADRGIRVKLRSKGDLGPDPQGDMQIRFASRAR